MQHGRKVRAKCRFPPAKNLCFQAVIPPLIGSMLRLAYLFERFPSFGQTFCYREVGELVRQGADVTIFSIRRPTGEPPQDWDEKIVGRVAYLPDEAELVKGVTRAARAGELPKEATEMLAEWDRQPDFLRLYQAAYVGLRLRSTGIDRVHAHFAGMAARTAYWIQRFFGIEYSLTAHANDIFAPRDFAVSLGKIFDAARAVVTVSDFSAAELKTRFPENAAKIFRIYNGVALESFRAATFESATPLIVGVGRLIEKKGFGDLIRACRLLNERERQFGCEIIGEGPLAETLSTQIWEAQLQGKVELSGPRTQTQIADRLACANVFALPCTREADGGTDNLPTAIIEAMATGLPVVSTSIAGIPEMVRPGVTGELVPAGDPPALADAIDKIITEPALARDLGSRGRELAAEKFSLEKNVRALAAILQQRD